MVPLKGESHNALRVIGDWFYGIMAILQNQRREKSNSSLMPSQCESNLERPSPTKEFNYTLP